MRGALRSHDFDTITCVRRCERAVMFFVTSLCFGRYASGAFFVEHSPHRKFWKFTGMWAHSPARAHVCGHVCAGCVHVFFAARSPLRSAAHFNPSGLAFGLLKNKMLVFREILKNLLQNGKFRRFPKNPPSARISHTRHSRAHNTMYMCASMHTATRRVRVWTKPKDLT